MSPQLSQSSESPFRVMLVLGSVRPGRLALPITLWVHDLLSAFSDVDVDFVDLAEEDLPLMNEPEIPGSGSYVHDHTRAWSSRVASADGVIFVAPAYGDGLSPVVRNAIDYLDSEWHGKNAALVSYGRDARRMSRRMSRSLQARGMKVVRPLVAIPDARTRTHGCEFEEDIHSSRACTRMVDELCSTSSRDQAVLAGRTIVQAVTQRI